MEASASAYEGEPLGRPMYPHELLEDPAAVPALDVQATALLDAHDDPADRRRRQVAEAKSRHVGEGTRLLAELLDAYPEPERLFGLVERHGSWGERSVQVTVSVPLVAAAYLRASGTSAAAALTLGLEALAEGIPPEFIGVLAGPTKDGAAKRAAGAKPHWKREDACLTHLAAGVRHWTRYVAGERRDVESGAHPLAHAAWRFLAAAWLEGEQAEQAERAEGSNG